eukprot:scaffold405_cov243-Pinguiococcus_pyrenoidosus.AAC.13
MAAVTTTLAALTACEKAGDQLKKRLRGGRGLRNLGKLLGRPSPVAFKVQRDGRLEELHVVIQAEVFVALGHGLDAICGRNQALHAVPSGLTKLLDLLPNFRQTLEHRLCLVHGIVASPACCLAWWRRIDQERGGKTGRVKGEEQRANRAVLKLDDNRARLEEAGGLLVLRQSPHERTAELVGSFNQMQPGALLKQQNARGALCSPTHRLAHQLRVQLRDPTRRAA